KDTLASGEIEAAIEWLTKLQIAFRHSRGDGSGSIDVHDGLRRAIEELRRLARTKDLRRAARAGEPLAQLAGGLLARALLAIAYRVHIGDPEGTVLLAGDVSPRHDFGFSMKDAALRARSAWSVPRQEVAPGVPWHVSGSLLGLEVALAPLSLRRM